MSIEDLPAGVSVSEALGLEDASEYQVAYGNALRQVAASGDAAELRALLPNVEDVDARSSDGLTAFLLACGNGQVECMEILRDAGCDVSATSTDGSTALLMAAGHGRCPWTLQWLLNEGEVELEARNDLGLTAFLCTCATGQVKCMEVLRDAGCDVTAKLQRAANKFTAMDLARLSGNDVAMQLLLPNDATCWVCMDAKCEGSPDEPLLSTDCACCREGSSSGRVHLSCLVSVAQHRETAWDECPTCEQRYRGDMEVRMARARW
jgi:hypothetical protein